MLRLARGSRLRLRSLTATACVLTMVATFTMAAGGAKNARSVHGGNMTVLLPAEDVWHGLDPAAQPGFIHYPFFPDTVYGNLFELGPRGKIIPDLATGYKISPDAKTATIYLRHGVTFSDGTPFNAAAVKATFERDLAPSNGDACQCIATFPVGAIDTLSDYKVVLHLTKPFSPIITGLWMNAPNWIASPTALRKEGAKQFAIHPVGAGPFKVVTDNVGSVLKLVRNPHYWAKGKPYVNSLTFKTVATDQDGYETLQADQAQSYMQLTTFQLALQAKKSLTVATEENYEVWGVQLNTLKAPFNNIKAREAMYYATDPKAINQVVLRGLGVVTETPSSPDSLFYESKVPGYRTYDLSKAKALVRQLGGLNIRILGANSPAGNSLMEALESEWSRAGISTTIDAVSLNTYIQAASHGDWQVQAVDVDVLAPSLGTGLHFRFASDSSSSGVHDPALQKLLNEGVATTNPVKQARIYDQVYKLISDKAYAPMLFSEPDFTVSVHGVNGPGLTTSSPEVLWEDVSM